MKIAQVRQFDVANGPGVRVSIFVSGCNHNCYNCFNALYQDYDYGDKFDEVYKKYLFSFIANDHVDGVSFLGGEPMDHAIDLSILAKEIKATFPDKDIWVWSGYTWEEILEDSNKIEFLKTIDVLVDGRFIESLKNLNLRFRGSSNQRIINVQESLREQEIKLVDMTKF